MPLGLPSLPNDALASYHFSVEIDSTEIAQFSELSGITSEIDVIDPVPEARARLTAEFTVNCHATATAAPAWQSANG